MTFMLYLGCRFPGDALRARFSAVAELVFCSVPGKSRYRTFDVPGLHLSGNRVNQDLMAVFELDRGRR
jgi:hypothetical protein